MAVTFLGREVYPIKHIMETYADFFYKIKTYRGCLEKLGPPDYVVYWGIKKQHENSWILSEKDWTRSMPLILHQGRFIMPTFYICIIYHPMI